MYLEHKVELYRVLQPHSNINCAQPARDADNDDDADGLTGFASFLFPPKMTQAFFVPNESIYTMGFNWSHPSVMCARGTLGQYQLSKGVSDNKEEKNL